MIIFNKTIFHLLAVAWKRALFTEIMLLSKKKHTYILAHLMKSSSIGTTITKNSFRNQDYENETELSKYIWQLKRNGTQANLKWSIAVYGTLYKCGTRRCDLCLTEKYIIARPNQNNLLNRRTEFISKCRIYFIRHILNWFTVKQFKS